MSVSNNPISFDTLKHQLELNAQNNPKDRWEFTRALGTIISSLKSANKENWIQNKELKDILTQTIGKINTESNNNELIIKCNKIFDKIFPTPPVIITFRNQQFVIPLPSKSELLNTLLKFHKDQGKTHTIEKLRTEIDIGSLLDIEYSGNNSYHLEPDDVLHVLNYLENGLNENNIIKIISLSDVFQIDLYDVKKIFKKFLTEQNFIKYYKEVIAYPFAHHLIPTCIEFIQELVYMNSFVHVNSFGGLMSPEEYFPFIFDEASPQLIKIASLFRHPQLFPLEFAHLMYLPLEKTHTVPHKFYGSQSACTPKEQLHVISFYDFVLRFINVSRNEIFENFKTIDEVIQELASPLGIQTPSLLSLITECAYIYCEDEEIIVPDNVLRVRATDCRNVKRFVTQAETVWLEFLDNLEEVDLSYAKEVMISACIKLKTILISKDCVIKYDGQPPEECKIEYLDN